ncbi:hypothetical protein ACFX2I_027670 [Malus domestica]
MDGDDKIRVMFVTPDDGERKVQYGQREDSLDDVAMVRVGRYEKEHMCDTPANNSIGWRDPGFIHDAEDSDETTAFMFGYMRTTTPYATFLRTQDESIATVKWIFWPSSTTQLEITHASSATSVIRRSKGHKALWPSLPASISSSASTSSLSSSASTASPSWPTYRFKGAHA